MRRLVSVDSERYTAALDALCTCLGVTTGVVLSSLCFVLFLCLAFLAIMYWHALE